MATMRRAVSLNSVSALSLRARTLTARSRLFSVPSTTSASRLRSLPALSQTRHYAFHAQLENNPNAESLQASQAPTGPAKPQTLVEKIVQKYADGLAPGKVVRSGDYVTLRPHATMTHDNTSAVMEKFKGLGATKVNDPSQLVYTADHEVQAEANYSATGKYAKMAAFAQEQGVWMSPPKYGIGHQIMVEEGWAWPQTLCVASDSHSNHYGGVGCLGTPVVRTDAAGLWTLSKFWWQVPPVVKITLTGMLPPGVTGKDVIVALCGLFGDAVLNHVIEFAGSEQTLNSLPIDHRLTISNMTTEFGALGGIFPVDDKLISWYRSKAIIAALGDSERPPTMFSPTSDRINHARIDELDQNRIAADPNAVYAKELYMNLSTLSPFVSGPNSVKVANPLSKLEPQNIEIQKAYLVSCTNSRASDIAAAAQVFREAAERGDSAKVHPNVEFYLAAASKAEQKFAEEAGDWQILQEAGAKVLPSGCGPCIGLGAGLIQDGETAISASNRNFLGRMGSRVKTNAYLGSPEVVAASAIKGKIAGPNWYEKPDGVEKVIIGEGSGDHVADQASAVMDGFDKLLSEMDSMIASAEGGEGAAPVEASTTGAEELTEVLPGFPEKIEGEILFLDQDQLNTDGIYPGKYTYQSMSKEHMAEVCMENYDSDFGKIAKPGDILVGGYNFGTGSSREQAATSILAKQIPLVIAASFSNIFSRNSINNALMGVEVPKLVERLREAFKDDKEKPLTRRTGWKLLWDVRRSKVVITEKDGKTWEQKVGELPPNVQEIASQGLEAWIKTKLQQQQQS